MALQARRRFLAAGVLTLIGPGASAACPDIDASLGSAEQDVVAYFLADAQTALDQAVEGFGCAAGTARQRARYWQTQAVVWSFEGDGRAESGLAAAKREDPDWFFEDFGEDLRTQWQDAILPSGPAVSLVVKGKSPAERVWVDGTPVEDAVGPGLHLLQVGVEVPRVARVFPAVEGRITIAVPAASADVGISPEPTPLAVPAPVVVPGPVVAPAPEVVAAPEVVPEPVVAPQPADPAPDRLAARFAVPLGGVGRRTVDANGRVLTWKGDVIALAEQRADGLRAIRQLRGNTWRQVGAGAVAAGGGYATYLFGWEALVGRSGNPQVTSTALIVSGTATLLGVSSFLRLRRGRARLRDAVRAEASRALESR